MSLKMNHICEILSRNMDISVAFFGFIYIMLLV